MRKPISKLKIHFKKAQAENKYLIFPQNPRKRGKSHYQHKEVVLDSHPVMGSAHKVDAEKFRQSLGLKSPDFIVTGRKQDNYLHCK